MNTCEYPFTILSHGTNMSKYTFYVGYSTEVSLKITFEQKLDGYFKATCTHPSGEPSLGKSWFFFSDIEYDAKTMTASDESITGLLDKLCDLLYEGVVPYLDKYGFDAKKYFREHLYIAFAIGRTPRNMRVELTVAEAVNRKV